MAILQIGPGTGYGFSICSVGPQTSILEISTTPVVSAPSIPTFSGELVLQLESLDFDASASTSPVSFWRDKSGYENNFNQSVVAAMPRLDDSRLANGHKTLFHAWNGNYPYVRNANNFLSSSVGADIFFVFTKPTTGYPPANVGALFSMGRSVNSPALHPNSDRNWYENFGSNARLLLGIPNNIPTSSVYSVYNVSTGNTSQFTASLNNHQFYSSSVVTSSFADPYGENYAIGFTNALGGFFGDGHTAAVYVYKKKLSDSERNLVKTYINTTWGTSLV
jgi:hypothetical protein